VIKHVGSKTFKVVAVIEVFQSPPGLARH
jgi:hypothetical protein